MATEVLRSPTERRFSDSPFPTRNTRRQSDAVEPSTIVSAETPAEINRRLQRIYDIRNYQFEVVRAATFHAWTDPHVKGAEVAAAGFVCLHQDDLVQCFWCRVVVGYWEEGDVPMDEHRKHNPSCPFVQGKALGNVTIDGSEVDRVLTSIVSAALTDSRDPPTSMTRLATDSSTIPVNQLYSRHHKNLEDRLRSFHQTSKVFPPAEKMAKAGFFLLGLGDVAVCYACGGGVFNWAPTDDPSERHAALYPLCAGVGAGADPGADKVSRPVTFSREVTDKSNRHLILEKPIAQELLKMGMSKELVTDALWQQMNTNLVLPADMGQAIELVYDYDGSL